MSEADNGTNDRLPYEYTPEQLRRMDDDTARAELTVDQFERREKIIALHDGADEQRAEWEAEDERVTDLVVHADPELLGTEVDLYGNDVLVHMDTDDDALVGTIRSLESEFGDVDRDDIDLLDAGSREEFAAYVTDALDAMIVRWNGHGWGDLGDAERRAILADAREKWGLDAMFLGLVDAITAVQRDREERVDVVDSFRGA